MQKQKPDSFPVFNPEADPLFTLALKRLLTVEGGYSDDPNDAGGSTNREVTQDTYDDWQREYHEYYKQYGLARNAKGKWTNYRSVRDITRDEAALIYKEKFWNEVHADNLPPDIAVVVFDTAANSHPAKALDLLQHELGLGPKATQAQIDAKLNAIEHKVGTQQFVDNYLNARWHYVDVYLPSIRPKDLHFQRGWYERYGQVRDLSLDLNRHRMGGKPENNPLVLGDSGDYYSVEANKHGRFIVPGDPANGIPNYPLPGRAGTYIMVDSRSHWPLMDDKGNVIVFDNPADGYKTVSGGAFVGTLDEPGTKPAYPKTGLPVPGMGQPHPGRPNQPPAHLPLSPGPSPAEGSGVPRSTPAAVAAASSGQVNPTPVPDRAAGALGTDQAAGIAPNPEQHYAAVPQGFGRWSMLHRQTHQYLPDPWGNRLYFSSPEQGYQAASARMNSAAAAQRQVAGGAKEYLTPRPPSLQVGGVGDQTPGPLPVRLGERRCQAVILPAGLCTPFTPS